MSRLAKAWFTPEEEAAYHASRDEWFRRVDEALNEDLKATCTLSELADALRERRAKKEEL